MAFPTNYSTFTPFPSGTTSQATDDHAGRHTTEGGAISSLERIVGLSQGSAILEDFSTGQRAVRMSATGGTLQHSINGTINNAVMGTPAITGGTANNQVVGTPNVTGGTYTNANLAGTVRQTTQDQLIGTNVVRSNSIIQTGWNYITWTNPSTQKSVVITFPIAFDDTNYSAHVTPIGYKAGTPASRVDVTGVAGNVYGAQALRTSGSQMTVYITANATEANTNSVLFEWLAIGSKA